MAHTLAPRAIDGSADGGVAQPIYAVYFTNMGSQHRKYIISIKDNKMVILIIIILPGNNNNSNGRCSQIPGTSNKTN